MNSKEVDNLEHFVAVRMLLIFLAAFGLLIASFFTSIAQFAIIFALLSGFVHIIISGKIAINRHVSFPYIKQNIYKGWKAKFYGYFFIVALLILSLLIYTNIEEVLSNPSMVFSINIDSYVNVIVGAVLGIILGSYYNKISSMEHTVLLEKYGSNLM